MTTLVRVLEWDRDHPSREKAMEFRMSTILFVPLLLWFLFRPRTGGWFDLDPVLLVLGVANVAWTLFEVLRREIRSHSVAIERPPPISADPGPGAGSLDDDRGMDTGALEREAELFSRLSSSDWRVVEERFREIGRDPKLGRRFWSVAPDHLERRLALRCGQKDRSVGQALDTAVERGDLPFYPPYEAYKASYRYLWSFVLESVNAREAVPEMRYPFAPFLRPRGGEQDPERKGAA